MPLAVLCAGVLSACASGPSGAMMDGFTEPAPAGNNASRSISAAMGGGLIGTATGVRLDDRDRRRALEAEYRALEYGQAGQAMAWSGDRGGGEVVAYQPYRVGSQDCRQYAHTVTFGGQPQSLRGTACRNQDGSWTPLI